MDIQKLTAGQVDQNRTWNMDYYMPNAVSDIEKFAQRVDALYAKLQEISGFYDDMLEWAFAYDNASMSAKKMIVSHLIERVYVFRDYRLKVKFNMSIEQFLISLVGAA
mgnify:CR=1 FL=1